jgi:hypothetical protein
VTVNQGGSQTFTATANSGKQIDVWKLNGNTVQNGGTTYTLSNVQSNVTVQVTFKDEPVTTYTVTASAGSGGSISPSGSVTVNQGGSQTFTATANSGKQSDVWKLNGNVVQNGETTYTLSNVQSNVTVQVTFKDEIPDSNEEVEKNEIILYPKGSSLIVKSAVEMTAVEVYSASGQLVRKIRLNGFEVRIDNLPKGVLITRVTSGKETKIIKIVVRR